MSAIVMPSESECYLLAIIQASDGLDLAEFSWYDPESNDGCYRAWDFQWNWYTNNHIYQIDQGGRALGKALALDTPVPTPTGWTTMGELGVGDQVFDDGGQICTVLEAHPVLRERTCYQVTFSDGTKIVADHEHLWETWTRLERKNLYRSGQSWGPHVRSTAEILETLTVGRESNHSIDVAGPLLLPDADLAIEPYVLGVLLTCGRVDGDVVHVRTHHARRVVAEELWDRGYTTTAPYNDLNAGRHFSISGHPELVAAVRARVIPTEYLRASVRQRRDLLHGIMDAAGVVRRGGHSYITIVDERIARGVNELLTSLGEQPYFNTYATHYTVAFRARVNPALRFTPDRFVPLGPQSTRVTQRRIVSVRPVASVPVRCITVDSPSSLYLVSDAMIPTHNTVGIKMRAAAFPFAYEGQAMLVTAPELNHLRPLTDAVEKTLLSTRLLREMLPDGKGKGVARQPHWQVRFRNGTSIVSRLPNKDGRGVKGQHVINIELDEAQDYPAQGWTEVVETLNAGLPGAMWRCHGVSKGIRDKFFEKTQANSGWIVHRPMAMHRPTWNATERDAKIVEYGGSRQAIDYRRNIYGEHGDASASVFVLAKLMACVDLDEGSVYNQDVYAKIQMEHESFPEGAKDDERLALLHSWIDLPGNHKHGYSQKINGKEVGSPKGYTAYWGGMDVGVTNHPSELLVFGQRTGSEFLELLTRINMRRINTDDQMHVVSMVMNFYGTKLRLGIDKTGVGFPIWDRLTRQPYGDRIYGFGFSEKRVVAFEDRELTGSETIADLALYRNVVEAATDWLRSDYVDIRRFRLPYDREVLIEFQGQTYTTVKATGDAYGTQRKFSGGSFHTLDAAKIAAATKHIPPLEALLSAQPAQDSVLDQFMDMY